MIPKGIISKAGFIEPDASEPVTVYLRAPPAAAPQWILKLKTSYDKKKIYQVALDHPLAQEDFNTILSGVSLNDGDIKADELHLPHQVA